MARPSPARARTRAAPKPRLEVVKRRSRGLIERRSTRLAPVATLAVICVAAVVFGVLLEQVILAQSAYRLSAVRKRMMAAEAANQELLLEATKLQSPGRIERYARNELGMVEPQTLQYVAADVRPPDGARLATRRTDPDPGRG
ncbi:MAG: hypothetical protein ACRDJ5_07575, partial [Actinomycetota bacterium]